MKIESLVMSVGTVEDFLRTHPECALLIERGGEMGPARIETGCFGGASELKGSTQFLKRDTLRSLQSRVNESLSPDARVEWLVKSDRNPFSGFLTVGRAGNNDVIVHNASVSKLHALFHPLDGGWFVQDQGSRNKTFVDGVALKAQERRELVDQCSVRLGPDVTARFFTPNSLWRFCEAMRAASPLRIALD